MNEGNDLDDIFEEYEREDFQESNVAVDNEENAANTESTENQTREIVPVPKRVIRNPRLKFNPDRLCGERGIPILTKHFKNVKFKGKGHEKEDLNKLMSTLELWTHRLFPSMKFEACLRHIEKLGKKRAVQTCMAKIRRDMPILKGDFVDDEEDDVEREEMHMEAKAEPDPEDAFDRLFEERQSYPHLPSTPQNPGLSGVVLGSSFGSALTEEQRKRMKYNKMLATERRRSKMVAMSKTTAQDSREVSPGLLETTFGESNINSSLADNQDRQFDSLLEETVAIVSKATRGESENVSPSVSETTSGPSNMSSILAVNEDWQFESLLEKTKAIEKTVSNSTIEDSEDMSPRVLETTSGPSNMSSILAVNEDWQFDSLLEKTVSIDKLIAPFSTDKESTLEDSKQVNQNTDQVFKNPPSSNSKFEDISNKPCQKSLSEVNLMNNQSTFDQCKLDNELEYTLSKEGQEAVTTSNSIGTGNGLPQPCQNVTQSSSHQVSFASKHKATNGSIDVHQCEPIDEFVPHEAEELGLDELMELVDEDNDT